MVSIRKSVLVFAAAALAGAQDVQRQAFNDVKAQPPGLAQPRQVPEVARALTPEMRGDIFMARKMYREAVEAYADGPKNSPILINKIGIAYHQMLELDTAKKFYERAIKLDSKYSEAINNLGTVHYAKKSYRRAVGQYKKALKLAPNSASIHSNLGTAWFARKKYKEAAEEYETALKLDPEVFEHRNSHGVLLQERSVAERAKFHFYLARTYAKSGQVERALTYMRKAIEEGFKDKKKFQEEPEFAMLQELPEFKELLLMEPRVL
jgi:tetratricopeptide (TPR) repeat protein